MLMFHRWSRRGNCEEAVPSAGLLTFGCDTGELTAANGIKPKWRHSGSRDMIRDRLSAIGVEASAPSCFMCGILNCD